MTPFGLDDDEWLAAQYLLFLDETGDEAEARRRVERLRNQRAAQRHHPIPPFLPPPPPPASLQPQRGLWQRFWARLRS